MAAGTDAADKRQDACESNGRAPNRRVKPARLHLDFLDGLRALAALTVIVDHAYSIVWYETAGAADRGQRVLAGLLCC